MKKPPPAIEIDRRVNEPRSENGDVGVLTDVDPLYPQRIGMREVVGAPACREREDETGTPQDFDGHIAIPTIGVGEDGQDDADFLFQISKRTDHLVLGLLRSDGVHERVRSPMGPERNTLSGHAA